MKNIVKVLITLMLINIGLSQDEIYMKTGKVIIAKVDRSTVKKGANSIRYKERFESSYKFINVNSINFIRSWNGSLLYPVGVIVNTTSGKIHLPNVEHLPGELERLEYASKEEAVDNGFNVCTACFDNSPMLGDLALEMELTKETILAIQNENEIMYEHEKLPVLQSFVDKIRSNWPEKLKGYDYRIQVIRNKQPNAIAVPGGNLYFTTGLIEMAENDSELEAVVAHEIAHVERRHGLRGYKDYLKKQAILAAAGTALALLAIASDSEDAAVGAAILTTAGAFALDFAHIGYNRDLEQEADMFAQIYLARKNEPVTPMLAALDKLATHTGSRTGYVPEANAFSSHPDLMSRINQLKHGSLYDFDEPIKIEFQKSKKKIPLENGFLNMDINYLYWAPSSDNASEKEIIIAGTIFNNDGNYSFQINKMILNFVGTLGQEQLDGLVDLVVPRASSIDFVGRVKSPNKYSFAVIQSLKEKRIIPYGVHVSAVILKPGEKIEKVKKMTNMKCGLLVK
jgi:Zn-dependent protease with chaperone function